MKFRFTWYICQLCKYGGFLLIIAGIYFVIPGFPTPELVEGALRWWVGAQAIGGGILTVMVSESWLVLFQTERNTSEMIDVLRRIERRLEARGRERDAS